MHKAVAIIFGLFLLTLMSCQSMQNFKTSKKPPNFIVILTDDQGWNGTSVQMMDNEPLSKSDFHETPALEKLAKEGMRFSNAYASAPVCSPSRYSFQFGQTPARLQMIRVGMDTSHIDHNNPNTIAKTLKFIDVNYQTAHFGKWGIDVSPSILGYDESDGITGNKDGSFDYKSQTKQWGNNLSKDPKKIFSITERAVRFLEKNATTKNPFYLQISHYALHSNIMMRKETLEKYQQKKPGIRHSHIGFAAMTEDLDSSIGLILEALKELGLEKNTYVIFTSDNGAVPIMPPKRFYKRGVNYPLQRGKWDALEGGIRVPFIVRGPNVKASTENKAAISFSDLLPTLADLAGNPIKPNKKLDGGSFKDNLYTGKSTPIKRNTEGLFFHVPYANGIALKRAHSAVRRLQYKLIKYHDTGAIELYNLEKDLKEATNLSKEKPNLARELEMLLDNYLHEVKAPKWQAGIHWKHKTFKTINSFH